jgi:hypothetical protein
MVFIHCNISHIRWAYYFIESILYVDLHLEGQPNVKDNRNA